MIGRGISVNYCIPLPRRKKKEGGTSDFEIHLAQNLVSAPKRRKALSSVSLCCLLGKIGKREKKKGGKNHPM